ncbi:enoyl-CoA hydratase/isomerase family protein [Hahella ganghwensis]|uniref:enoyl-CoA hydratase/isomerase family protein n=1 Tax=Hahella ganghwensis TaxID=286420 RepID=UPI00036ACC83|nr:enoyl-CoA hydratase/isomerase family protein [Hahella ganghwensis]
MTDSKPSLIIEERPCQSGQRMGYACLNAPESLNALTLPMIRQLTKALNQWRQDSQICFVWLEGAGDRAFCAGGDIVKLYESMTSDKFTTNVVSNKNDKSSPGTNLYAEKFFSEEYRLDYLIHRFSKPIVCWGHGVVMGGGLGLMSGASHRVVTEQSRIAMPEVSIGLFPDVGGTWFLSRMSGGAGLYLGLTGASCNAADAIELDWADNFLPSSQRTHLIEALQRLQWSSGESNHSRVTQLLRAWQEQHKAQLPIGQIAEHRDLVRQVTRGDTLAEVVDSILSLPAKDGWLKKSQDSLINACPTSLHLVWRQVQEGGRLTLSEVFRQELVMALQCTTHGEFKEGVRALLIDKDRKPKWRYQNVSSVPPSYIQKFFTPPWKKNPLDDLSSH